MTEAQFQILVSLSYRIAATFAFGLPLCLFIWSKFSNVSAINRLLSIYWKVSSLYAISILFLSAESQVGHLTSFISPLLMVSSIWFWIDLNEEIDEMSEREAIALTTRIWRWTLTIWGILTAALHIFSWECLYSLSSNYCTNWTEIPGNAFIISKILIKFILGGNWSTPVATFFGYLSLILYLLGLIQWLIIQLPKHGRFARKF